MLLHEDPEILERGVAQFRILVLSPGLQGLEAAGQDLFRGKLLGSLLGRLARSLALGRRLGFYGRRRGGGRLRLRLGFGLRLRLRLGLFFLGFFLFRLLFLISLRFIFFFCWSTIFLVTILFLISCLFFFAIIDDFEFSNLKSN